MKHKPNPSFFYRGNDIIKLWEQYLKQSFDNNGENVQFYTEDGNISSIFNGLTQQKEIAIILNHDGTLYRNNDGYTITLCGEIDYKYEDISGKIKAVLDQIIAYNQSNENKIANHIILFPYHVSHVHWNLGVVGLQVDEGNVVSNHTISVYEPYGGQTEAENYILKQISLILPGSTPTSKKVINKSQQNDGSSCGAITAENGKEFLKKQAFEQNMLEIQYPKGATELRSRHIEEINEEAFYQTQMKNRAYEAKGDKSIENQFEIIKLLREIIEIPKYDWVKPVLFLTQDQDDEIKRESLDLFKKFLIQLNISAGIEQQVVTSILRNDGGFKAGSIDLISTLAFNFSVVSNNWFDDVDKSSLSIQQRNFVIRRTDEVAKERDGKLAIVKTKLEHNEKFSIDD